MQLDIQVKKMLFSVLIKRRYQNLVHTTRFRNNLRQLQSTSKGWKTKSLIKFWE